MDQQIGVHGALSVDEHAPLSRELSTSLRVWHVHRPGYGANGPARVPGSIEAYADLVASVLDRVGTGPAHVVGASYSAAVALSLAARPPDAVRSLALVEPPPYDTPGATGFRSAIEELVDVHAGWVAGRHWTTSCGWPTVPAGGPTASGTCPGRSVT